MLRKLLWVFPPLVLFAQPTCPEVVHGTASFSSSDQRMEIVSGDKTIIHWQSFSIDPSESVIFNQLDSKFSVLNRVLSSDASKLLGTIQSNGNVLLINPNGVLTGKTARIDTNGFLGSTLDVLDSDFLNGKDLKFSGSSINSIVNLGTIQSHGGDITLIGRFVTNEGTLDAGIGSVTLAVGSKILIKPSDESKVFISASESSPSSTGLSNSGRECLLKK